MFNRLKTRLNSVLTNDTGQFAFVNNLPILISWLFVLPIAIFSYIIVKLLIIIVMYMVIILISSMSQDAIYWFNFITGSLLGQLLCTFVFCFYGSAMAPKYNNIVCLILGGLFIIPLLVGYFTIIFILPYVCCVMGICLAIIYRKRKYQ